MIRTLEVIAFSVVFILLAYCIANAFIGNFFPMLYLGLAFGLLGVIFLGIVLVVVIQDMKK
jgi:hypothetical protein